jgi:hypothetical protein
MYYRVFSNETNSLIRAIEKGQKGLKQHFKLKFYWFYCKKYEFFAILLNKQLVKNN